MHKSYRGGALQRVLFSALAFLMLQQPAYALTTSEANTAAQKLKSQGEQFIFDTEGETGTDYSKTVSGAGTLNCSAINYRVCDGGSRQLSTFSLKLDFRIKDILNGGLRIEEIIDECDSTSCLDGIAERVIRKKMTLGEVGPLIIHGLTGNLAAYLKPQPADEQAQENYNRIVSEFLELN